jgi:hypothetical protein
MLLPRSPRAHFSLHTPNHTRSPTLAPRCAGAVQAGPRKGAEGAVPHPQTTDGGGVSLALLTAPAPAYAGMMLLKFICLLTSRVTGGRSISRTTHWVSAIRSSLPGTKLGAKLRAFFCFSWI